jgi:hypothetical protein
MLTYAAAGGGAAGAYCGAPQFWEAAAATGGMLGHSRYADIC